MVTPPPTRPEQTQPRKLVRKRNVKFEFTSKDGQPFEVTAQDASIGAARFSSAAKERILAAERSAQAFFRPDMPTMLRDINPFDSPRQSNHEAFVISYKPSPQYRVGDYIRGTQGHYSIIQFLGAGQSAETYKAKVENIDAPLRGKHDIRNSKDGIEIGSEVVVKVPLFNPCLNLPQLIQQSMAIGNLFIMEEATLLRLTSLDCVAHFVETGDHWFPIREVPRTRLLIQRFVAGKPLDEYLQINYSNGNHGKFNGLHAKEFYRLAHGLAEAIREAHSRLVIHGDIWPSNILVLENDKPILIDFGQAVLRDAVGLTITIEGRNARYIAPEQGKSVAGDIYSLGGVFYYLATGEDPPQRLPTDVDDLKNHVVQVIQRTNPGLYEENRGVADIIGHCLRLSDQRTAHVYGVIQELDTFFGERSRAPVVETLKSVRQEAAQLDKENHELFTRMANLSLKALQATLSDMASGVYDLVGDHEVIVSGLSQYLRLLDQGDEYLTISVPRFWYGRNLGINGRYLSMNILAAQRGAIVKRLFIVTEADRKTPEFNAMIEAQTKVLKELNGSSFKGRYEVKLRNMTETAADELIKKGHHFGLLISHQSEIAVFPEYRTDGSLSAVRFRSNLISGLRQTFDEYWLSPDSSPIFP